MINLAQLASETEVLKLPCYQPISEEKLLKDLQRLGEASIKLIPEDTVSYSGAGEKVNLNKDFKIPYETIEEILTDQVLTGTHEMILKVKKPDYLGQSMWEFKHEGKPYSAQLN